MPAADPTPLVVVYVEAEHIELKAGSFSFGWHKDGACYLLIDGKPVERTQRLDFSIDFSTDGIPRLTLRMIP